jgi:hypothetical protein
MLLAPLSFFCHTNRYINITYYLQNNGTSEPGLSEFSGFTEFFVRAAPRGCPLSEPKFTEFENSCRILSKPYKGGTQ